MVLAGHGINVPFLAHFPRREVKHNPRALAAPPRVASARVTTRQQLNTSKWNVTSRAALLIAFTAGLIACGGPDVSGQDCDTEEPCLDSQGPWTNEQPLPCGDTSGCEEPPPDGGEGGGSPAPQYTSVRIIVRNPTTVAKDMRAWADGTVGWPATVVARWEMSRRLLAPGAEVVFNDALRIPYGGLLSIENTVWEPNDAGSWSGRGWGPNTVSTPTVTCIAKVWDVGWPNAAHVTCSAP